MYIDKYKVTNMRYLWNKGKQDKKLSITHSLNSDDSIKDKDFISLLDTLHDVWNQHESKDIHIEVTFKPCKEY